MNLVQRRVYAKQPEPAPVPSHDDGEELVLSLYGFEPLQYKEKILAQTEVFAVKEQVDSRRWVWRGPEGLKLDRFEADRAIWITRVAISNPKELAVLFKETELAQPHLPLFLQPGETLTLTFGRELIWITRT